MTAKLGFAGSVEELRGILNMLTIVMTRSPSTPADCGGGSPLPLRRNCDHPRSQPQSRRHRRPRRSPARARCVALGAKKRHLQALQRAQGPVTCSAEPMADRVEQQRNARLNHRAEHESGRAAFERKKEQRNGEVLLPSETPTEGARGHRCHNAMVLERSNYPTAFRRNSGWPTCRSPRQLVAEYEIPTATVIPRTSAYSWPKTRDEVKETPRKAAEIKDIYQHVVSAVCLRTIHELLAADQGHHIAVVCFEWIIQTVDPATGKDTRPPPHLSARVTGRLRLC